MTISSPKFKGIYRIESDRLKGWDYGGHGYYFVTICTKNMAHWFGEVSADQIVLSDVGEIVAEELEKTDHVRPSVSLDTWVVMPNHIHAIIVIDATQGVDVETPRRGVYSNQELEAWYFGRDHQPI
jgi:REP element-mobilizing transposase RayT